MQTLAKRFPTDKEAVLAFVKHEGAMNWLRLQPKEYEHSVAMRAVTKSSELVCCTQKNIRMSLLLCYCWS